MGISNLINGGKTAVKKAVERFPIAIVLSATVALGTIYMTERSMYGWEHGLSRFTAVLCLGIPLYLCIQVFLERINKENHKSRYWYYGIGALLMVLYWRFVYTEVSMVIVTRHIGLVLILLLGFLFIPYVKREENFEIYIIKILSRLFITAIYAFVLQIGISAILATLNYLLEINIKYEFYLYAWILILGVFVPCFFLGGVPKKNEELRGTQYPKGLKVLMLYIIMPLISIYTVILYIYFGKIIITSKWPDGLVSHLVLWYGVISAGTLFLISDLKRTNKWAELYSNVFPMAILPLMVMMFTSIGIRIDEYGVTENRYYVMALGIWVFGIMIYLAISRRKRFIILPISVAVIMVVSILGPFSSYSISVRSQNKRFTEILKRNNMLTEGEIVNAEGEVSERDQQDMTSILHYFDRSHSLSQVKYLPKDFNFSKIETVIGISDIQVNYNNGVKYFYFASEDSLASLDIREYDYLFEASTYIGSGSRYGEGVTADYRLDGNKFIIYKDGEDVYSKDLKECADEVINIIGIDYVGKQITKEKMIFEEENGKAKVKFIFKYISGNINVGTNKLDSLDCQFYVLVKVK